MSTPPAQPISAAAPAEAAYLVLRCAGERYALVSAAVREIARWRAPTPVPGAPALLPGIISQRGVVLPIVDLRLLLALPAAPPDRETRLVICQHEPVDLALLVDGVDDLVQLPADQLAQPPAGLEPRRAHLLAAVARHDDQPLAILDLPALIAAVQEAM